MLSRNDVIGTLPGAGWRLRRKAINGSEVVYPVLGFVIKTDGKALPVIVQPSTGHGWLDPQTEEEKDKPIWKDTLEPPDEAAT